MIEPLVTVLMAVHNGAAHVEAAVESILRQSFTDFEFLIIDDGSTDDTPQRLVRFHDPRVRLLRNDVNIGLTRSLNLGLRHARGALIARHDADDISHVGRLATQLQYFEQNPHVVVLGTQARYINARGERIAVAPWPKATSPLAIKWQLLFDGPFFHASVMFRKAIIWDELGGYDETFVSSQDFELWSRVEARGCPMANLPSEWIDFRVHSGSVSSRYELKNITKLRTVLLDNLNRAIAPAAAPEGWPETWIRLNNPRAFPHSADSPSALTHSLEAIHRAFVSRHPEAVGNEEIHRHLAAMFVRLAISCAERGWVSSMVPFVKSVRLDPNVAIGSFPRYIASASLGLIRRIAARVRRDRNRNVVVTKGRVPR